LLSPVYFATMVCVPTASAPVMNTAWLPFSGCVARNMLPS